MSSLSLSPYPTIYYNIIIVYVYNTYSRYNRARFGYGSMKHSGPIECYMNTIEPRYIISIAHREFESIRFQGRPLPSIIVIVIIIIIIITHTVYSISYTYVYIYYRNRGTYNVIILFYCTRSGDIIIRRHFTRRT
jgi:hypothetical protein